MSSIARICFRFGRWFRKSKINVSLPQMKRPALRETRWICTSVTSIRIYRSIRTNQRRSSILTGTTSSTTHRNPVAPSWRIIKTAVRQRTWPRRPCLTFSDSSWFPAPISRKWRAANASRQRIHKRTRPTRFFPQTPHCIFSSGGLPLQASKGCAYRCACCNFARDHRLMFEKPVSELVDELKAVSNRGIRYVWFVDDNFERFGRKRSYC